VTAPQLALELEVSERTARRDLEALAMAGVPVYSQPGRGGGWSLVGGARTDLSGLTAAEARTLFLVAGPSAATRQPRPLGRGHRATGGTPGRVDLTAAWQSMLATLDERRLPFKAVVRAYAEVVAVLRYVFGTRLAVNPGPNAGSRRMEVEVRGPSAEIVAAELAGFGDRLEVISPEEVRTQLARIGAELVPFSLAERQSAIYHPPAPARAPRGAVRRKRQP
jgi:predicted DNA-binding transcriptional regulator YafY